MKISELELILKNAREAYGDVDVLLIDPEFGDQIPIKCVTKTHPMTAKYGCLNRDEPVCGVVLHRSIGHSKDLILSNVTHDPLGK